MTFLYALINIYISFLSFSFYIFSILYFEVSGVFLNFFYSDLKNYIFSIFLFVFLSTVFPIPYIRSVLQ